MFNFLDRTRSRPPHERRRVAFFLALLLTLVIAIVWFVSLRVRLGSGAATPEGESAPMPFGSLVDQLKGGFSALKNSITK